MRTIERHDLPLEAVEFSERLGGLIKLKRKSRKISQEEICKRCFISRSTLSEIEAGSPRVQFAHWIVVMHELDMIDLIIETLLREEMIEMVNLEKFRNSK